MQGFRGWRIVAVAFLTQAVSIAVTMGTFTFFVQPVEQEFGASRATVTLGVSMMFLVMGTTLPFIGRALDRRSARAIMLIGAGLIAASLLLLSAASALWQMAILCVGAGLGLAMLGPVASSTVVANWFEEKRGLALGITNMGAAAGPLVFAPFAALGIEALGWRGMLVAYAAATLLLAVPAVWLVIVNRPSDVGEVPDGKLPAARPAAGAGHDPAAAPAHANPGWTTGDLFRSSYFWCLAITIGIVLAAPIVMGAHLAPYCASVGITAQATSFLLVATSAATIAGTFGFGALADRVDLRRLLWTAIGVQATCWTALLLEPPYAAMFLIFAAFGVCAGATMPIYGSLIARHFGPAAFGQVMGLAGLLMLPIHFSAPPLVGALYDSTGNYTLAIEFIIATLGLAALSLAFLRPARA